MDTPGISEKNKTARFFFKICRLIYLAGFPNFWMEELNFSKKFTKIYRLFSTFSNVLIYIFIITEWGAMFTQSNLTEKQRSDRLVFCLSHPLLSSYRLILTYHEEKLKELLYTLSVELKEKVNDEEIEKGMIRKALLYSSLFVGICSLSLILYGIDGFYQTMKSDATFTTVITAWPTVEDKSTSAGVARVLCYIIWWVFMSRVFGAYTVLVSLMVALEYQYKNLGQYFQNLSGIFEQDLSQAQKEKKYEESLKIGIKLHATTLRCTRLAQASFSTIYGGQILLNTYVMVLIMFHMVSSERTLANVLATIATGVAMLISTGFLMWSGGDISVQAANLPTDIYWSGWHNCRATATGTSKLVALAMLQGQRSVIIKGLEVITVSYSAYLSIVKSAYSVFSVLY